MAHSSIASAEIAKGPSARFLFPEEMIARSKSVSYKLGSCLFSLLWHGDHIRTVQFHHNEPWIVSASDDKTIRVWNWKSRTCICVFKGYSHHVTCASFHPEKYLVVSAAMDGTLRVWDVSSLTKKQQSFLDFGSFEKHVLEGHNQVNGASFHPTLPLIFSAGDDHRVIIWQMDGENARNESIDRAHTWHILCSVHARQDVVVSSSQDMTIRVWDATTGACLEVLDWTERVWILTCHPSSSFLGAGDDNGLIVFKLVRKRPAFDVNGDSVLFVENRVLHVFDCLNGKDVELMPLSALPDSNYLTKGCRTLSYNSSERTVLFCSRRHLGCYELYTLPKDNYGRGNSVQQAKSGDGGSSVFVAQGRFAVLKKSTNQVLVKNLKNETVKEIVLPIATDVIFPAGNGNLLCGGEDRVVLFDLQQQIVIQTSFIRYVVWAGDMKSVALLSRYSIVIADKKLVPRCKVQEKVYVKSGTWDDDGIFVYTTEKHIKYCLPNGETGIIKTLNVPKYITKIYGNTIFCLDRDGTNYAVLIDSTEDMFKLLLLRKGYD